MSPHSRLAKKRSAVAWAKQSPVLFIEGTKPASRQRRLKARARQAYWPR